MSGANVSHPVWVNSELKSDRTQTDAEGRFELSVIGKDLVTYSNIWIWHDGYSLATPSLYQFIPSVAEHASREVLLQPESLVRFRIERPDGRTLANADVYPAEMRISNYPESLDGMHGLYSFPPDDELKKFTMRKTDENGEVQLRHVPVEVLSAVGVVTEEFGIQEFYSEYLTGPRRLMLEPVGRLHGTAPPGTRIAIQSRPVSTPPVICEGRANVVADADGNFVVKALAAGKVLIMPHNAEHPEWLMEDQYAELQPASTLTLDIVPQATIPATGRLVLADSKLPIANVRVWLQVGPRRTSLGLMLTDADGKFTARCLPGKRLNAQVTLLPEATMLYPKPTQLIGSVPLDATSFELPDIEIRTIRIGKGKLVDANNNPVAGKYVQHYFDNKAIDYSFRTTDNGEFDYVIDKEIITDHWAAILKWSLRDKSGNAGHANDRFEVEATVISEDPLVLQIQDPDPAQANVLTPLPPHPPRVLPVDGEGRPIKDGEAEATGTPDKGQDFACTVIDPDGKPVIPVSMTIVDAANGRPITNARIMEGTHFKSNRAGRWEWGWTREQSNSEGRLETSLRALDHVIQFRIQGKGYRPALSQEFDAAALPDSPISLQIRLDADNGFSGTVLQPDGRPAAGAMIYTKSESKPNTSKNLYIENGVVDESQITSSTTADTSGRFQLQPHVEPFECLIDHDSGYLKLMDVELMQQSELELQPWASVKGELWLRGVPAANIGVQLLMRDEFLDDESQLPHIGFSQNIQTDAAGKFTFPKCIAGEWERIITYDETITSTRSGERNYVHYDTVRLLSGQERHEVIGKDGADVVGRVMFPEDPKIVTNECDIYADNIDARMLNDGRSGQSYDNVKLQPDGSFHLFNLPVATHEIQFFVPVMGEQSLRTRYSQKIVITPERFVGRSPTSPIDLGEIQVEPIE